MTETRKSSLTISHVSIIVKEVDNRKNHLYMFTFASSLKKFHMKKHCFGVCSDKTIVFKTRNTHTFQFDQNFAVAVPSLN